MLHIYTGSTDGRRGSDEFRLREAYRALRGDLDSDGMLELNTTELPARGATPQPADRARLRRSRSWPRRGSSWSRGC